MSLLRQRNKICLIVSLVSSPLSSIQLSIFSILCHLASAHRDLPAFVLSLQRFSIAPLLLSSYLLCSSVQRYALLIYLPLFSVVRFQRVKA